MTTRADAESVTCPTCGEAPGRPCHRLPCDPPAIPKFRTSVHRERWLLASTHDRRNLAIVRAVTGGESVSSVARRYTISRQRVNQIMRSTLRP